MSEEGEPIDPAESFIMPPDGEHEPVAIAGRLVRDLDEFNHLKHGEAAILFLMRVDSKVKKQRAILGEMALAQFQGTLGPVASWMLARLCNGAPDFLMILDAQWWQQASPTQREALVFHELLHAAHKQDKDGEPRFTDEGRPIWDIRGHDLEEFDAVAERYGDALPGSRSFVDAFNRYRGA